LKNKKEKTEKDYAALQKLEGELEMATQVISPLPQNPVPPQTSEWGLIVRNFKCTMNA